MLDGYFLLSTKMADTTLAREGLEFDADEFICLDLLDWLTRISQLRNGQSHEIILNVDSDRRFIGDGGIKLDVETLMSNLIQYLNINSITTLFRYYNVNQVVSECGKKVRLTITRRGE